MPRRRESVAPQDPMAVMMAKIAKIEADLANIKQAGPSALQADDWEKTSEPFPWQTQINHPGLHRDATPEDTVVYYHPGDEDVGGSTTPGFKGVGIPPSLPYAYIFEGSNETHGIFGGVTLPGGNWAPGIGGIPGTNGDRWAHSHPTILEVKIWTPSFTDIRCHQPGIYLTTAFARWTQEAASGTQHFTIESAVSSTEGPHDAFGGYQLSNRIPPHTSISEYGEAQYTYWIEDEPNGHGIQTNFQASVSSKTVDVLWIAVVQLVAF